MSHLRGSPFLIVFLRSTESGQHTSVSNVLKVNIYPLFHNLSQWTEKHCTFLTLHRIRSDLPLTLPETYNCNEGSSGTE